MRSHVALHSTQVEVTVKLIARSRFQGVAPLCHLLIATCLLTSASALDAQTSPQTPDIPAKFDSPTAAADYVKTSTGFGPIRFGPCPTGWSSSAPWTGCRTSMRSASSRLRCCPSFAAEPHVTGLRTLADFVTQRAR